MFGLGVVPAMLLGLGMIILPDSPRSLINRGYHQEAHNLLRRIYGKLEENIFHDIVASMEQQTTG